MSQPLNRVPAGTPTGGRFAETARAESALSLPGAATPSHLRHDDQARRVQVDRLLATLDDAAQRRQRVWPLPQSEHRSSTLAEATRTATSVMSDLADRLGDDPDPVVRLRVASARRVQDRVRRTSEQPSSPQRSQALADLGHDAFQYARDLAEHARRADEQTLATERDAFHTGGSDDEPDHTGCLDGGERHECRCWISAPCAACVECPAD